jgi:hypothetical protein
MWLPRRHRRAVAKDWATIPFWSLTLPSWAMVRPMSSHRAGEPESATWTCATCGTALKGTAAVTRHVESHHTRGTNDAIRVPVAPGW